MLRRPRLDPVPAVAVLLLVGVVAVTAGVATRSQGTPRAWTVPAPATVAAAPMDPAPMDPAEAAAPPEPGQLTPPAVSARPQASAAWVASVGAATGIGSVALAAYADATLALAGDQPSCRLGWTTLAAIGGIESGHGTYGGAELREDGRPTIPIVGPALDGRPGFAAIPAAPDATAWHGDPVWDHAIGPLQFLPSTWRRWGADADGDGAADPNDTDDAALAAGRYLCAAGADLTAAPAWRAAVLTYNHSEAYVSEVLTAANGYAVASRQAAGRL